MGPDVFLLCVWPGLLGREVDWILWEQQLEDIPVKLVHADMESLPVVAEANTNARQHLHNYNVEADNSGVWSVSSGEDRSCREEEIGEETS